MSSRATDTRDGDETFLYQEARIKALQAAMKKRETVLGVDLRDFLDDLSEAVDWVSEGFPYGQTSPMDVRHYEVIPMFGQGTLRMLGNDEAEYLVRFTLVDVNLAKKTATYEISEI